MIEDFSTTEFLLLPGIIIVIFIVLASSIISILFIIQKSRLPYATKFVDLEEKVAIAEATLSEKRTQLSDIDRQITLRDHLTAEIGGLNDQIEKIQTELSSLDAARTEIEDVKQQAASAAGDYAKFVLRKEELEEKCRDIQNRYDWLEDKIPNLENDLEELKERKEKLEGTIQPLRDEAEIAQRAIAEAKHQDVKVEIKRQELETLEKEILDKSDLVSDLRAQVSELENQRSELSQIKEEVSDCNDELTKKQTRLQALQLEIERIEKEMGAANSGQPAPAAILEDLKMKPLCLSSPTKLRNEPVTEERSLERLEQDLKGLDLKYSWRTQFAFHTALKINDKSQMTILSGVSGTGKSLLPRRYSESLGIHFLQIAVEPRWDSPQDLLGFYNYIEKSYRATELARLMVYLDPHNTSNLITQGEQNFNERVALVLLDEMNLARVEYYFSEFLSRLEARPEYDFSGDAVKRRNATIPMDIRGLDQAISLFPSHNLLFAGTMNDDESTNSLSDKVLDRSNILQFSAPNRFTAATQANNIEVNSEALKFSTWRKWIKNYDDMDARSKEMSIKTINKLGKIMRDMGRPFGHRMNDSIMAYCANYPRVGPAQRDINIPLMDQIELRLLPKLRGVELENQRENFEALTLVIRQDLQQNTFADYFDNIIEEQSRTTGLFNWRGYTSNE